MYTFLGKNIKKSYYTGCDISYSGKFLSYKVKTREITVTWSEFFKQDAETCDITICKGDVVMLGGEEFNIIDVKHDVENNTSMFYTDKVLSTHEEEGERERIEREAKEKNVEEEKRRNEYLEKMNKLYDKSSRIDNKGFFEWFYNIFK